MWVKVNIVAYVSHAKEEKEHSYRLDLMILLIIIISVVLE